MRLRHVFTSLVAAATAIVIGSSSPAFADPQPQAELRTQPPATSDITAAYQTAPCDKSGTTSTDASLATSLNRTLNEKMRGYMSAYRVSCARMVVKAVHDRGLDRRAAVIAVATIIVETSVQNISEEVDHDSLGLFQQRASWGSRSQRLDPAWATNAFLDKMLRVYPGNGWKSAPIGEVCQAVQVSAYPDRYQVQAGDAKIITDAIWPHVSGPEGTAKIYGALPDGRLTYTTIDAESGERTHGAVVSAASLGFTPKAIATLNFNTLLVTKPGNDGELYRVDIRTNNEELIFETPVLLGTGWTHDLLAYDGKSHLFGIAAGTLRRYTLTATKPAIGNITGNTLIGTGFTLKTLTTTGPDWILGTTTNGLLLSYKIKGKDDWDRHQLRDSTWQNFDALLSPGGGVYYGHSPAGALYRYHDGDPYDGKGDDLSGHGTVDTIGWAQTLLSAQPGTVT
ncbi:tachylectin-related carbohydrate-binding protein [Nonomuraea sp. NPDC049504]|uniref:tachylectin-related carbohydrate-binding protein n=1 Tax=Nonomuraea sp. NPDC049504 TaxID=3154729 RepID=UPI003420B6C1